MDTLLKRFTDNSKEEAIIWRDLSYSYDWLLQEISRCQRWLHDHHLASGTVVFLEGDFSPHSISMLLALWLYKNIVVPFAQASLTQRASFIDISQAEVVISFTADGQPVLQRTNREASHLLYDTLRKDQHGGLVLLSSGTTGSIKGIVHDITRFLAKVERIAPHPQRILAFLIFDHLGGIDTLIYSLATTGCLVVPSERTPDTVLATIEKHRVQAMPTSPSFLNLLLISGAFERYQLDSLRKISYGSEPMPQEVLKRLHQLLPKVKLTQTYGISEVGVMRSASEASDSLWMRVGGSGYETRIVDGVLQVRSPHMMLGYLNAPEATTSDGWFVTGDLVETSNDYVRIKGRTSEVINVGGEKVYPLEVEEVIRQLEEVADVLVYGESNPILGQIVCAKVISRLPKGDLRELVRRHCLKILPKYKVPVRIEMITDSLSGERHKRRRIGWEG